MKSRVKFSSFLRGIIVASTALAGAAALPVQAQDGAGQTVVTAARYIDVLTGKTVEFPAIFVGADGRITNIADARTVRWGSDVNHIDLCDKTLLPGLIDMHVHLDGPSDIGGYRGLEFNASFSGMTPVTTATNIPGHAYPT